MIKKLFFAFLIGLFTLPLDAWLPANSLSQKRLSLLAGSLTADVDKTFMDGTGSEAIFGANPSGSVVDSSGNLLITDSSNHAVRKVTPAGVVTTFVGMLGSSGSADGTGQEARFNNPKGITKDSSGNFYLADSGNCTIRKITPAGVVTTFLGTAGSCTVTDATGTAARFSQPSSVVIDSSGNFFIADTTRIRKSTPAGVVTTFAGNSTFGYTDGTGTAATFLMFSPMAIDSSNNLYVAGYNSVRKITPAAVATTIAGSSPTAGSTDGTGTAARFSGPGAIAIDSSNNLYVSDGGNYTVRKITPAGVVTTFLGTAGVSSYGDGTGSAAGAAGISSMAFDSSGNLYAASPTIRKITSAAVATTIAGNPPIVRTGSADGTGTAARFNGPTGVAMDSSENIFVADSANHTIRKITSAGVVTTLAGSPGISGTTNATGSAARFKNPKDLAIDSSGNIFVSDYGNHTIRKITSAGVVTTFVGTAGTAGTTDATGTSARFNFPTGLAFDSAGNLFVANTSGATIRKITPAGVVTTFAGTAGSTGATNGTGSAARFFYPQFMAIDSSDNLYVTENNNSVIRKITPAAVVTTYAGVMGTQAFLDGANASAQLSIPDGLTVDSNDDLYVADSGNNAIRKVTSTTTSTILRRGNTAIFYGKDLVRDSIGNIYACDYALHRIIKITPSLVVSTFAGYESSAKGSTDARGPAALFNIPEGPVMDNSGNVFVADSINHTIRKITPAGVVTTFAGTASAYGSTDATGSAARFYNPRALAIDSSGNLYVADSGNHTIRKITSAGVVTTLAGTAGSSGTTNGTGSAARFNGPSGITVDSSGNIFVADTTSHTIRKITSAGVVTTLVGTANTPGTADGTGAVARFRNPRGLSVDSSNNIFAADSDNHTIRRITQAGVVTTFAGSAGVAGSIDATGTSARLANPYGVSIDSRNNLYVADLGNHLVRKITSAGVVTTVLGARSPQYEFSSLPAKIVKPSGIAVKGGRLCITAENAILCSPLP